MNKYINISFKKILDTIKFTKYNLTLFNLKELAYVMNMKNRFLNMILAGLICLFGLVGTAQAVNVNPDGLGQVLIYPYYTVNGGNMTLLSVVNTTDQAKAVRIRFSEGQNSREVLGFNIYMAPEDVWVAAVVDINGTPFLEVNDTTCTSPYLYLVDFDNDDVRDGYQPFLPYALDDGGDDAIKRTTEGHFEIIEMGVVVNDTEDTADAVDLVDGVPNDCDQIQDAWTDPEGGDPGYWINDPTVDMRPPTGGLTGGAAIINVEDGSMYSYNATAINGWADNLDNGDYIIHQVPGSLLPNLNSGTETEGVVFLDDGDLLVSSGLTRSVDAVSFVLMHDQIMNEFVTESAIGAGTEWVLTFPTKRFYVDPEFNGDSLDPVAPFTSTWYVDPEDEDAPTPSACEVVMLDTVWDRNSSGLGDEVNIPIPPVVSPQLPTQPDPYIPFKVCYETSVIRFGAAYSGDRTEILGSGNFHNVNVKSLGFTSGWVRLGLDDYPYDADEDGEIDVDEENLSRDPLGGLEGLPVVGFSVQQFKNKYTGESKTVNATYSGLFNHNSTRKVYD